MFILPPIYIIMANAMAAAPAALLLMYALCLPTYSASTSSEEVEGGDQNGYSWRDSSEGVHSFVVFDYHLENDTAHVKGIAPRYDYVWGASAGTARHWRKGNPEIIVSQYIQWNLAPGWNLTSSSLAWLQANHPEWLLYKCDRKTLQMHDDKFPLIDVSQPAIVEWQLAQLAGADSQLIKSGYNAIAVDNFQIGLETHSNDSACGHFENGTWVQQYSGHVWDKAWQRDMLGWLAAFYAGLQAIPAEGRPLLILNNDLSWCAKGGCHWDDPTVLFVGNHSDGVLNEGAFGWVSFFPYTFAMDLTGHVTLFIIMCS
eukprot:COSAG01_NODE_2054_length_8538_cov_4.853656_1_plen_314_part_00